MTPGEFVQNGHAEYTKAAVHGTVLGLALVCTAYNAVAYGVRRERHLLVNTVIYGLLTGIEIYQVGRHLRKDRS